MKKIYTFILLMLLSVCSAFAQEPITKASELSNSKAYTISSSRATLQVLAEGTCLYASTGTATGLTDLDESNPNHRFALINGGKNFFLYSIGAGKFINNKGEYTDEVTSDVAINVVETESLFFPINLNWGDDYYLNTQEADQFATGYLIDDWSTIDNGNQFAIIEVGEFSDEAAIQKAKAFDETIITDTITYVLKCDGEVVSSYTRVIKGFAPLTITYDAPGTRVGAACSDETPASKEITESTTETVVYNYSMDLSALPFVPTTIGENGFADGTKWYFLQPFNSNTFCYSSDSDAGIKYKSTPGSHPIDLHYLFTFTGNPLAGFRIYNYVKGAASNIYGDHSSAYGTASFSPSKTCEYFLEAGTADGQYRFNKANVADSYLNGYTGEIIQFTWSYGWSSDDSGSQYYITEATDREIELALLGVLSADPSIASGTVFRNGDAMSSLQVIFEGTTDDTEIKIIEGMETGKITLVDEEGNVVATPTYAINADDKTMLDITFDPPFNTDGTYTLLIPESVVKGGTSGLVNPEVMFTYKFSSVFEEKILTARVHKNFDYNGYTYNNFESLPYTTHEDGEYYSVKLKLQGNDKFTIIDWEGIGDASQTMEIIFDPSLPYNNIKTINGEVEDSYESVWVSSSILHDTGYTGCYLYTDNYSWAEMDDEYGCMVLPYYSWDKYAWRYYSIDWYMDNRYSLEDLVEGTVHGGAFQELDYTDDDYPAFPELPYSATTGTYNVNVVVVNDTTIELQGYTGVEGENLTIVYDPETGDVISFNGLEIDSEGSSWITSSVLDGVTGGWYAYVGSYSVVKYDKETKSGYVIISGYEPGSNAYYYLYVAIGAYTPTTGIESVAAQNATSGKSAIYNIAGQRLSAPRKGFNIIDGKKVFNK